MIGLFFVLFMTLANLRGVRESATIFTLPTYLFIAAMLLTFLAAAIRILVLGEMPQAEAHAPIATESLTIFLLLGAFAWVHGPGGTEAISDGAGVQGAAGQERGDDVALDGHRARRAVRLGSACWPPSTTAARRA